MIAIFDIETDGLYYEATTVWCMSVKILKPDAPATQVFTNRPIKGSAGSIEDGLKLLTAATTLVGHNIINFDIPTIKKLYPDWTYDGDTYDTLIASKLSHPNLMLGDANRKRLPGKLKGSHGLKAWGYRLGNYKDEHEDWSRLSVDMVEYCRQDAEVTAKLYKRLIQKQIPDEAMRLEQDFAHIIARQEHYGWKFDIDKAQQLHVKLLKEAEEAEDELYKVFTPLKDWIVMKEAPKFNKDGSLNKRRQSQELKGACFNDDLEWGHWKELVFNPGSRQHISRWLKHFYGWTSPEFTEKGNPIINEKILNALEFPEGKILAHYFNVKKVIAMVAEGNNAWLKMVKDDGRIHGSIDTLGAVSRRCTHSRPNVAQVPSSRAYMGSECRQLFTVSEGKKLVGCDADGLELRTLSHYMAKHDGGVYARAVDEGKKEDGTDIHTLNQQGAGLPTRDDSKTFIYAFLYGAGDGKIGEIVKGTAKDGKRLKEKFLKQIPAIAQLSEGVQEAVKKNGTLKALDGNPYYIRSPHSALNTLLQGCGALVMKYWLIELDKQLQEKYEAGTQYEFVGNIHDEAQIECDEEIAHDIGKIASGAFDAVTTQLNFRIPLRGSYDVGQTWEDTH